MANEPVFERDAVEGTDIAHATLGVNDRTHNGGGAQGHSVLHLVHRRELRRGEERFEAVERRADLEVANLEAEVQEPHVSVVVDKRVRVVLQQQVLQCPRLGHEAEEVEVAAKEHMQPHLNVVAVFVAPGGDLATNVWPLVVHIHLITLVQQLYCGGKPRQTGTNDGHLQLGRICRHVGHIWEQGRQRCVFRRHVTGAGGEPLGAVQVGSGTFRQTAPACLLRGGWWCYCPRSNCSSTAPQGRSLTIAGGTPERAEAAEHTSPNLHFLNPWTVPGWHTSTLMQKLNSSVGERKHATVSGLPVKGAKPKH